MLSFQDTSYKNLYVTATSLHTEVIDPQVIFDAPLKSL